MCRTALATQGLFNNESSYFTFVKTLYFYWLSYGGKYIQTKWNKSIVTGPPIANFTSLLLALGLGLWPLINKKVTLFTVKKLVEKYIGF